MKPWIALAIRVKIWTSLAAQMNHNMNIVTTTDPLMTDASIAIVVDLNTLYKNEIAKKIILVKSNIMISPR
jgi:hypothetical protein